MTQYILQILISPEPGYKQPFPVGYLMKSFKVSPETPIPTVVPITREQVLMTNTNSFNGIVQTFNEYGGMNVCFTYDALRANIDCSGAVTNSWPIN